MNQIINDKTGYPESTAEQKKAKTAAMKQVHVKYDLCIKAIEEIPKLQAEVKTLKESLEGAQTPLEQHILALDNAFEQYEKVCSQAGSFPYHDSYVPPTIFHAEQKQFSRRTVMEAVEEKHGLNVDDCQKVVSIKSRQP